VLGESNIVAVVGWQIADTNGPMVEAWKKVGIPAYLLRPFETRLLGPGDVAIIRLDVLPTLDGVEDGLIEVVGLQHRGVRVVNSPRALLTAHDKLLTARCLEQAGIPHPRTVHMRTADELSEVRPPFVVKPRFGSWGHDVMLCRSVADRKRCVSAVRDRSWFVRQGALVQELVPPRRHDLRLIVAAGQVVGAAERSAAPGEWRTNVSLGGSLAPAEAPDAAADLGVAAAKAIGADFVGVDLLPTSEHDYVVLELNGAADFDERYSLGQGDVFVDVAGALGLAAPSDLRRAALALSA
jgi:ribosomal protein S6--L-glutamate ligase